MRDRFVLRYCSFFGGWIWNLPIQFAGDKRPVRKGEHKENIMNEFEAYYSRAHAVIFLLIFLLGGGSMFAIFLYHTPANVQGVEKWATVAIFAILAIVILSIFIVSVRKSGIAVEVRDEKLIFHKTNRVEIPLNTIISVTVHNGLGSFDVSVTAIDARYSMHCFVKQDLKKKRQLIKLLERKGINVSAINLG